MQAAQQVAGGLVQTIVIRQCLKSAECVAGKMGETAEALGKLWEGISDGLKHQGQGIAGSTAAVFDEATAERLDQIYGQDVSGMAQTILAANAGVVLLEVVPLAKAGKLVKVGDKLDKDTPDADRPQVVDTQKTDAGDGGAVDAENNFVNNTGQYLNDFEPSPTPVQLVQNADGKVYTASIRYDHVLDGNINGIGNGTGGHYIRSKNVRVVEVIDPPDANGVIRAQTQIRDPQTGGWIDKLAPTTFFPEHWSRRQTVEEIEGAFRNSKPMPNSSSLWQGTSPSGVKIRGYYIKPEGGAATAWPVRTGDK